MYIFISDHNFDEPGHIVTQCDATYHDNEAALLCNICVKNVCTA